MLRLTHDVYIKQFPNLVGRVFVCDKVLYNTRSSHAGLIFSLVLLRTYINTTKLRFNLGKGILDALFI